LPLLAAVLVQFDVETPTATQTVVLSVVLPEVPVTVTEYAPVVVVEVVVAVRVEVSAVEPERETEAGDKLQVAGFEAPEGAVTEQVSVTVPEKELVGVAVMGTVFPEVAPAEKEMEPLLVKVKLPLLGGACQKSPHPAKSGMAAIMIRAHLPILMPLLRVCGACAAGVCGSV
jgi:hypothetical protein